MKKFINLFSYIFHPLFVGLYGAVLFFLVEGKWFQMQEMYFYLLQVLILTVLIPITLFYLLLSLGKITSFQIATINERKFPLMINCLLFSILIKTSFTIATMPPMFFYFLGAIIASVICWISLFFDKKISLHSIGITSLTTFAIGLSIHLHTNLIGTISFLILSIGMVFSSRILMKAHHYSELWAGFLIGIITQIPLWFFWVGIWCL